MEETYEGEIFKGSENRLIMTQTYTHKFQCVYNLAKYPFDKQNCSIEIKTSNLESSLLGLYPKELTMTKKVRNLVPDMTPFHMEEGFLNFTDESAPEEGISMTIRLRRKILPEFTGIYFPSGLVLMISYFTNFFKQPIYFEAAVTVNLTNMLVMTTIFISVMDKLPPTPYLKMIDTWLIFCQLIPFFEVIDQKQKSIFLCSRSLSSLARNSGGTMTLKETKLWQRFQRTLQLSILGKKREIQQMRPGLINRTERSKEQEPE